MIIVYVIIILFIAAGVTLVAKRPKKTVDRDIDIDQKDNIEYTEFRPGFLADPPQKIADLCGENRENVPPQLYVDYGRNVDSTGMDCDVNTFNAAP